jgi:hypothetical protein
MSICARVVRYRVTPTAGRSRLIGSLVRLTSLLIAFQDTLLLPVARLACALSLAVLSFPVFLFRDYLVPLTVRYYLLLYFYYLVYLAGGSSAAGRFL